MLRMHVIGAVFWRNLMSYFTSVLGYVFLVWFVTSCAVLAFSQQFFAENLANLDQLSKYYPLLLLTIVPAITMGVWADEKRQGTDAILFTLPGSDLDFLIGKFLSVVAVYTIALAFSSVQLVALAWIGNPDIRVIMTTYFGYWLVGVALLSIGMFASSLTKNVTVAYVLGAIFCSIPVLIGYYFKDWLVIQTLSVQWHLESFTRGLVTMTGVVYFVSIVALMLYLNLVVNTRRHWSRGQQLSMGAQFAVRVIAVAVAVLSINVIADSTNATRLGSIDFTKERLYSLERSTQKVMAKLKKEDKSVTLKAFISQEVPAKYIAIKKRLEGILRQYKRAGGNNISIETIYVEPNTDEATEARTLGVNPRSTQESIGGKVVTQDVYMGIVVNGAANDVTLEFLGEGSSLEYQITRSIASASDSSKQFRVGVLNTDAHFLGVETTDRVETASARVIPWNHDKLLQQMKKHYRMERVSHDLLGKLVSDLLIGAESSEETPGIQPPDVMLVVNPSSLPDPVMLNLIAYIKQGHPVLILADPLPFYSSVYYNPDGIGIVCAPRQPRLGPRGRWQELNCSQEQKSANGRATPLADALGLKWNNGQVVWHAFQPHQSFPGKIPDYYEGEWPEYWGPRDLLYTFVRSHGDYEGFNRENEVSKGISELLFFYGGSIAPDDESDLTFSPLITLEKDSGKFLWSQITEAVKERLAIRDPATGQERVFEREAYSLHTDHPVLAVKPEPERELDDNEYVMAAHITGNEENKANVIFICDSDFVSDMIFDLQNEETMPSVDNVAFFQNALEFLAGDTSFVSLRNRRPEARTLTVIEETIEQFRNERLKKQAEVEETIDEELEKAKSRIVETQKSIESDKELSIRQKSQQTQVSLQNEQSLFDQRRRELERKLAKEIERFKAEENQKVKSVEWGFQWFWILFSPAPVLILGICVCVVRIRNERLGIDPARRV